MIGHLNPGRTDRVAAIGSLVVAFAIAAVFYRFGSFALECLAFLATWALLELPAQWLTNLVNGADRNPPAR
jgi:hypothetical protein